MLEYHLPGLDHKALSDQEFAQKWAHLGYIRQQELKLSAQIAGATIQT